MNAQAEYLNIQPLVDRLERPAGYRISGGDIACGDVVEHMQASGPLAHPLFVDCRLDALDDPRLRGVDASRFVFSLTGFPGDPQAGIAKLEALRKRGARVMIADASPGSAWLALIGEANYARLNASTLSDEHLARFADALARRETKIVVTGLATRADFARASDAGIDFFEGYWFTEVAADDAKAVAPIYAAVLRALSLVRAEAEFREIEQVIRTDPTLTYKLIRYVNSAAFSQSRKIGAIGDAIALLGYRPLGRWLALSLVTAKIEGGAGAAIARTAIRRGRLMELVAANAGHGDHADEAFMTGLCSMLDALLGMPVELVVEKLAPPEDVSRALIAREGELGELLGLAAACDDADQGVVDPLARRFGLGPRRLGVLQLDALGWAERQLG